MQYWEIHEGVYEWVESIYTQSKLQGAKRRCGPPDPTPQEGMFWPEAENVIGTSCCKDGGDGREEEEEEEKLILRITPIVASPVLTMRKLWLSNLAKLVTSVRASSTWWPSRA